MRKVNCDECAVSWPGSPNHKDCRQCGGMGWVCAEDCTRCRGTGRCDQHVHVAITDKEFMLFKSGLRDFLSDANFRFDERIEHYHDIVLCVHHYLQLQHNACCKDCGGRGWIHLVAHGVANEEETTTNEEGDKEARPRRSIVVPR